MKVKLFRYTPKNVLQDNITWDNISVYGHSKKVPKGFLKKPKKLTTTNLHQTFVDCEEKEIE